MICTDNSSTDYLAHTIAYFDKMKSNFTGHSSGESEKLLRGRWSVCRQYSTLQSDRSIRTVRLPHKYVKLYWNLHHEFEKFLKGSFIVVIGKVRNGNADRIIGDRWLWYRWIKFRWISTSIINNYTEFPVISYHDFMIRFLTSYAFKNVISKWVLFAGVTNLRTSESECCTCWYHSADYATDAHSGWQATFWLSSRNMNSHYT